MNIEKWKKEEDEKKKEGTEKGKVNSGEKITSVFNYWGTNEDSESNKQFVLKVLSCKTQ